MSDERNASNVTTNTNPDTTGAQGMASEPVISVRDLTVSFASEAGTVRAVRGMNFDLYPGKTLGIVGESGSGKSVTSMAIMGLLDKNASVKGSITYHGEELLSKSDLEMSEIRGKGIAMVFQDPLSALTPVFSIGDQIKEALVTHNPKMTEQQIHDRSIELMNLVGIPDPEGRLKSFPHEFSGGMRQRVMIAMAIANDPDVIIADEPTTALDVTIQAQVLEVLRKAQRETGAAVIFITHDSGADRRRGRRHRRHVRRPPGREGGRRLHLRPPGHAVHHGPAGCRAAFRPRTQQPPGADSGLPDEPGQHAQGVPVRAACRWPPTSATPPSRPWSRCRLPGPVRGLPPHPEFATRA